VLDAAVSRGHTLDICMRTRPHRERVLTTDFERWPSNYTTCHHSTPDAIIATRLENFVCDEGPGLRVVVPYFAEFLMRPIEDYDDVILCYPSVELAVQHGAYYRNHPVTGWTIADHAVKHPPGGARNLHTFFTMKRDVPRQQRVPYLRIAWMDRALAHCRGLRWAVKTRHKHKDPWWLKPLADVYLGDTMMYPHTSHHMLSHSASMSHFTSGAVAEAVLHNVPSFWYRYDHRFAHLKPHQVQHASLHQPWLMSKETYVKRFLGWDDGQNGARVIGAIERRVP
jgi:hypothetical protein